MTVRAMVSKKICLFVLLIFTVLVLSSCSGSIQTFKYSYEMSEFLGRGLWNLLSKEGAFEAQLIVYGQKIRIVDKNGNESYLTIKEQDFQNGKIVTEEGREFLTLKSGNIKEGDQEYRKVEDVVESNADKIYDEAIKIYRTKRGNSFFGEENRDKESYANATEIIEILETLPDDYIRFGKQTKEKAITLIKNVRDSSFVGKWEYTEWDDRSSYIFRVDIHSSFRAAKTGYGDYEYFDGELWLIQNCYTMDGEYFWTPESGTEIPFTGTSKFMMKDGNLTVIDNGYAWTAHRYE